MMETCVSLTNSGLLSSCYHYQPLLFVVVFLFFQDSKNFISKYCVRIHMPHSTEGRNQESRISLSNNMCDMYKYIDKHNILGSKRSTNQEFLLSQPVPTLKVIRKWPVHWANFNQSKVVPS